MEGSGANCLSDASPRLSTLVFLSSEPWSLERFQVYSPARSRHGISSAFYDFNVWSERKRVEKLRYMHPVKRVLVLAPEQWHWSSYCSYAYQDAGKVKINQWPKAVMKVRPEA